jgi:NAD(P)-dependent dehydrogenase (short-subunit alcohol dehydrogenase family)
MVGQLEGKTAFVTGAGRGIGRAIAARLAKEGAAVAAISRTAEQVEKTAADIVANGGRAIGFACDIGVPGAIQAAIERTARELGPVDILVNNAHDTAFFAMTGAVESVATAQIDGQMASGPYAALSAMQACFPHMKEHGGRVINMGSAAGPRGMAGFLPYAMSKEAMRALTRCAAREWGGYGITVNAICPAAPSESPKSEEDIAGMAAILKMNGGFSRAINRMSDTDDDIAPLVAFLAGPEAGFLTGYTYMIDGGSSIDAAR